MKEVTLVIIGIVVVVGSIFFFWNKPTTLPASLKVGSTSINIEIASTPDERAHGLSGRESLDENTGMLFIFEEVGDHGFWMNEMKFGIDIIWIDEYGSVIGIEKGVLPETYPAVFYPPLPVKYVLEVNAGQTEVWGVKIGDKVNFETQFRQNQGLSPYRLQGNFRKI